MVFYLEIKIFILKSTLAPYNFTKMQCIGNNETELKLIANAAIIGEKKTEKRI
jgi:hypothetical protein